MRTQPHPPIVPDFDAFRGARGFPPLTRRGVQTLQVNVGKLCDLACLHCHVEAGPGRKEIMTPEVIDRVLHLLATTPTIETVDITGGAPELNPGFRRLVARSRELGRRVMVRSNLTVLLRPEQEGTIEFFAQNQVQVVASLPCYTAGNVDSQRGDGTFLGSIEALQRLNRVGYGVGESLRLDLVYNPLGPTLPPPQATLETAYHERLFVDFGIRFDRLYTLANMPITRFAKHLERSGRLHAYEQLLVDSFNERVVDEVMCRDLISVGWDGTVYDCDFNQVVDLPVRSASDSESLSVFGLDSFDRVSRAPIRTGRHCFGCTAGNGSSCGGSLT